MPVYIHVCVRACIAPQIVLAVTISLLVAASLPCPDGKVCPSFGLTSDPCPKDHYCPQGTTHDDIPACPRLKYSEEGSAWEN